MSEIDPTLKQPPTFDVATHVPFAQAEHFEREGFSGDILVPKDAQMGFTALQVNVDGEHPLKEIGRGNTRSYYVVDGEGTFILDGEPKVVSKGDLVVIPTGSQYQYQGIMTLFEVNVSPRNTFKEKMVRPPKEVKPPEVKAQEEAKRENFRRAICVILGNGITLTNVEVREIAVHYGFSPLTGVNQIGSYKIKRYVDAHGGQFVEDQYRGRLIYRDGTIDPSETDLVATKAKIDARMEEQYGKK